MHPKSKVSVTTFREDPLYPRVARSVAATLGRGNVVAPVDVLVGMGLLTPERLEDWRRGRVAYLERVVRCNRTRLSRLLRILRFHAHDLKRAPSLTVYMRWGKGRRERLRFTRSGNPNLEEAYSRHFVWPGKGPFHAPCPKAEPPGPLTIGPRDDRADPGPDRRPEGRGQDDAAVARPGVEPEPPQPGGPGQSLAVNGGLRQGLSQSR